MTRNLLLILLFFTVSVVYCQQFTLNDLFRFEYYPESVDGGTSMNDGEHYTLQTSEGIDKFSYKTCLLYTSPSPRD